MFSNVKIVVIYFISNVVKQNCWLGSLMYEYVNKAESDCNVQSGEGKPVVIIQFSAV